MKRMNESYRAGQEEAFSDSRVNAHVLRLNFRDVPLQVVLNYFHETADLRIEVEPNVEIERAIDVWSEEPVNKQEALRLLKQALMKKGYTAIQKAGSLAVIRSQDAKKYYIPLPELACTAFSG